MLKKIIIIGATSLILTACQDTENQNPNNEDVNTPKTTQQDTSIDLSKTTVSLSDAVGVFLAAHPNTQIYSVELDSNWGKLEYEIKALDSSKEYEMRIDAETKKVLSDKNEVENEMKGSLDFAAIVEPADVLKVASEQPQVKGMSPISWDLEFDDGVQLYKIKYKENSNKIEVGVNALTGELLGVEIDD